MISTLTAAALWLGVTTAVAGCGFKPLYGDGAGSVDAATMESVSVAIIANRIGQKLRNLLVMRLSPRADDAVYELGVDLSESSVGLALARDATATRTDLTVTADFALLRLEDGAVVYADQVRSSNSYEVLDAEYATLAAEQNARDRAVRQLAELITLRLGLFFQRGG